MAKTRIYWTLTIIACLVLGASGVANLLRAEKLVESVTSLGYPLYLTQILGVAKILAVVAFLSPKWPILKEWAYAGVTFDLLGASVSHAFVKHSFAEIMIPLVILLIVIGSFVTRPPDRRIVSTLSAS
jgi:hypothetical protein